MIRFVLDASVTMAWCFEDEKDDYTKAVLDALRLTTAVVPWIWAFEVVNVLSVAERRRRLRVRDSTAFLDRLWPLPIEVDATPRDVLVGEILAVCRTTALTSYDAAYLALALRTGLPLATRDQELRRAASRRGVAHFEPEPLTRH